MSSSGKGNRQHSRAYFTHSMQHESSPTIAPSKPHTSLEICLQLVLIVVLDQLGWSHSLFQAFPRSLTSSTVAVRLDSTLTFTCKLVEPPRNFCPAAHKILSAVSSIPATPPTQQPHSTVKMAEVAQKQALASLKGYVSLLLSASINCTNITDSQQLPQIRRVLRSHDHLRQRHVQGPQGRRLRAGRLLRARSEVRWPGKFLELRKLATETKF
jgi:hypothetical protein